MEQSIGDKAKSPLANTFPRILTPIPARVPIAKRRETIAKAFVRNNRECTLTVTSCFAAPDVRLAVGLQLQVSAGGLLPQPVRAANGEPVLVVLHQQVHGIR